MERTSHIINLVHKIHIRHDVLGVARNVWHNDNVHSGISIDTMTGYSFSEYGVSRKYMLKRMAMGVDIKTNKVLKYSFFNVWVNSLNTIE